MVSGQNKWIDCIELRVGAVMSSFLRFLFIILTGCFVISVACADSGSTGSALGSSGSNGVAAYEFGHQDMQSLQFSRQTESDRAHRDIQSEVQTELSFKLSPGTFDFSSAGAFGLSGVFANPELEIISRPSGKYRLQESFPDLHNGLSYSAGIKIEHEDKDLADTVYVSSGQLGLSYGRLGQVWYSGVDLSIGQYSPLNSSQHSSEVVSLDFTTGRKMGLTGVGPHAPLWLFSLQGSFDIQSGNADAGGHDSADWYLNPSLFWRNPDFTFAAQLQVPVDSDVIKDFEEPDYRLRALFEKHFR